MTFQSLCSEIAFREGKKVEVSIGNIREIVRIIRDLIKENPIAVLKVLLK